MENQRGVLLYPDRAPARLSGVHRSSVSAPLSAHAHWCPGGFRTSTPAMHPPCDSPFHSLTVSAPRAEARGRSVPILLRAVGGLSVGPSIGPDWPTAPAGDRSLRPGGGEGECPAHNQIHGSSHSRLRKVHLIRPAWTWILQSAGWTVPRASANGTQSGGHETDRGNGRGVPAQSAGFHCPERPRHRIGAGPSRRFRPPARSTRLRSRTGPGRQPALRRGRGPKRRREWAAHLSGHRMREVAGEWRRTSGASSRSLLGSVLHVPTV